MLPAPYHVTSVIAEVKKLYEVTVIFMSIRITEIMAIVVLDKKVASMEI